MPPKTIWPRFDLDLGASLDLGCLVAHVEIVPLGARAIDRPQRRAHQKFGEDAPKVVGQDVRVPPRPKVSNGKIAHGTGDGRVGIQPTVTHTSPLNGQRWQQGPGVHRFRARPALARPFSLFALPIPESRQAPGVTDAPVPAKPLRCRRDESIMTRGYGEESRRLQTKERSWSGRR